MVVGGWILRQAHFNGHARPTLQLDCPGSVPHRAARAARPAIIVVHELAVDAHAHPIVVTDLEPVVARRWNRQIPRDLGRKRTIGFVVPEGVDAFQFLFHVAIADVHAKGQIERRNGLCHGCGCGVKGERRIHRLQSLREASPLRTEHLAGKQRLPQCLADSRSL